MTKELKLFSGNAHRALATEIGAYLKLPLGDADVTRFSDGEVFVQINENVRGSDVFVVQPTCPPVNDTLMELLIMIDAFKRASAGRITAVLPYYGYARQDRKVQGRVPITAKLVADLLTAAGVDRVLALDLHAGQIQGFFNIPVDHLFAGPPVIVEYLTKKDLRDPVVVAPDAGGVERARAIAKRLNAGLAIIDKRRDRPNVALMMHLIGDVSGRDCIIIDDMIATGGTMLRAAEACRKRGARSVRAIATHGLFGKGSEHFFADHHAYTQEDLDRVLESARELGVDAVVTTEKDAVRLEGLRHGDIPLYAAQLEIDLGRLQRVSGIVNGLGPYSTDAPRSLRVTVSSDGRGWSTAWEGLTGEHALRAAFDDPGRLGVQIRFAPIETRYVRLTQTGEATEWYWSIAELRILSDW